jgi:recombinational DNA repair protein (RecF pathway)
MTTRTNKNARRILLCALIRDGRDPPLQVFVDECFKCHRAVWRSESSPRKSQAVCRECLRTLQQSGAETIELPMNKRQQAELAKHFKELGTESLRNKQRGN